MKRQDCLYVAGDRLDDQQEYTSRIRQLNEEFEAHYHRRPRCYSHTYGCQQNENDTEYLNGMLMQMGYVFTDDRQAADLVLLNTCAVREHAQQRVFGNVGALLDAKRRNPEMVLCLCGCMTEQEQIRQQIREKFRHVDLVFGTRALYKFPENLYRVLTEKKRIFDTTNQDVVAEGLPIRRDSRLHARVSIMSGCNNFCSYCIVPYVRGRERSRKPEHVLAEVEGLVRDGYKDIMLLGQNVNSYCKDIGSEYDFSDLLTDINKIEGDFSIKFMTSHPKDASEKLIKTIAACEKVCRHLHLPFQSGSDRILERMNRRYTREKYAALVEYARREIPGLSVTSDVIVGFPGETEEDFAETLQLVRQIRFNGLYTFIYSPRQGTPAASMENQVPKEVKAERFQRLIDLQTEICTQINTAFLGKTVKVFVEGVSEKSDDIMTGRTGNNTIVQFAPSGKVLPGQTVSVKIDKTLNWAIFGKMTAEEER